MGPEAMGSETGTHRLDLVAAEPDASVLGLGLGSGAGVWPGPRRRDGGGQRPRERPMISFMISVVPP